MTDHIPVPIGLTPFENIPVDQRVAMIKKATSLLNSAGPKDLQPCDLYMSRKNWQHIFEVAKINKKFAHNVKKSHKTERKVSR